MWSHCSRSNSGILRQSSRWFFDRGNYRTGCSSHPQGLEACSERDTWRRVLCWAGLCQPQRMPWSWSATFCTQLGRSSKSLIDKVSVSLLETGKPGSLRYHLLDFDIKIGSSNRNCCCSRRKLLGYRCGQVQAGEGSVPSGRLTALGQTRLESGSKWMDSAR